MWIKASETPMRCAKPRTGAPRAVIGATAHSATYGIDKVLEALLVRKR